ATSYQQIRTRVVNASYETRRAVIRKIVNKIMVYEREREAEIEFNLAPSRGQWSPFEHNGLSREEAENRIVSSGVSDRSIKREYDSAIEHSIASSRSATTGHKSTSRPQDFKLRPSLIIKVKI